MLSSIKGCHILYMQNIIYGLEYLFDFIICFLIFLDFFLRFLRHGLLLNLKKIKKKNRFEQVIIAWQVVAIRFEMAGMGTQSSE